METYKTKTATYEVFSANMTIDTQADTYPNVVRLACKSCQQCRSQCYGCRTGFIGKGVENISSEEAEKILEILLKVA